MISKYNKFREELLLESLVNESFLYYSPNLRKLISKIGGDISDSLISSEYTDIKPDITFVDIDKEGYLSFITMRNAAKTLNNKYPHVEEERWSKDVLNSAYANSIWMSHENGGSDDVYKKSRNSIKIGKFINKLFTGKYKDKDIEEFVNKFKATIENSAERFEMVEGDDIAFWYKSENYAERSGTLGNSCMSGVNNIFNIYTKNPEVCKMLILKEDDKILGRALIWKLDSIKVHGMEITSEYFMDRQYTVKDSDVVKFRNYAKEKKWLIKANNNHHSLEPIIINGDEDNVKNATMTVKVKKTESSEHDYEYDKYPYLDTFRRFDPRTGILINDEEQGSDEEGCYILEETRGGRTLVESGHYSEWHNRFIPEDEAIYSEPYSDWLDSEYSVTIERGSRSGVYHQDDDYVIYDESIEEYIHSDDSVYSEVLGYSIFDETAVKVIIEIGNYGYIDSDGDWFPEGSDDIVTIDKSMTWYNFLENKFVNWDEFKYIIKSNNSYKHGIGWVEDIVIKNTNGDWIPKIFSIELYKIIPTSESIKVDSEYLSEVDAKILKYKIEGESIISDKFQYNKDIEEYLPMIYELLANEIDKIKGQLRGKGQLRLKFDEEDDTKYKEELKGKRQNLLERYSEIENSDFIEVELPDLDS
jgi:hypothetical protein